MFHREADVTELPPSEQEIGAGRVGRDGGFPYVGIAETRFFLTMSLASPVPSRVRWTSDKDVKGMKYRLSRSGMS